MHTFKKTDNLPENIANMTVGQLVGEFRSALERQHYDLAHRITAFLPHGHEVVESLLVGLPRVADKCWTRRGWFQRFDNGVMHWTFNGTTWSSRDLFELAKIAARSRDDAFEHMVAELGVDEQLELGAVVDVDDLDVVTDPLVGRDVLVRGRCYRFMGGVSRFVGITRVGTFWFAHNGEHYDRMCQTFDERHA